MCWQDGVLLGHSGAGTVDAQGPYAQWLARLAPAIWRQAAGPVRAEQLDHPAAADWPQWWPAEALWLPGAAPGCGWLLLRELPFADEEQATLMRWWQLWQSIERAALAAAPVSWWRRWQQAAPALRRRRWQIALMVLALVLAPVRLTVRAPGELVPREPVVLRAAVEGTVRALKVQPNEVVKAGQVLAELDDASWASRLQVARQSLATAEAEWRQTSQAALGDPKAKAQLPAAQGKLNEKLSEVRYLEQQVQRTALLAPHAGVVLIDDAGSWAGRTVQAGEALMRLAEPQDQELEAWLTVGDAIDLPAGTPMQLHLASRPADPVPAALRLYGYEAEHRPDGSLAYRLRGQLAGPPSERLGARGTVRIEGPSEPLVYAVLRRPLAALREATGW
jgi:multidrug efflux pump subunit AcrA (membrane-fusion protein)